MFPRLKIEHPHDFAATIKHRTWNPVVGRYEFHKITTKTISADYQRWLLSLLDSHALRILNQFHDPFDRQLDPYGFPAGIEEDELAMLLVRSFRTAARRVGVTVTPGRSQARHVAGGELSLEWLERISQRAVQFSCSNWDPAEAERVRQRASNGGRKARHPLRYTDPSILDPYLGMPLVKTAKHLGISVPVVRRLRSQHPFYVGRDA